MTLNLKSLKLASLLAALGLALAPTAIAQEYEWEPDEGLHEEEWYDPSDWFNDDNQVSYEEWDDAYEDDWDTTYYDNGYGAYDGDYWDYDYEPYYTDDALDYDYGTYNRYGDPGGYTSDWDTYDWDTNGQTNGAQANVPDYQFGKNLRGRVVGLESVRSRQGRPQSVRLKIRTDDGQTRTIHLGDVAFVRENLQRLRQGETVEIRGDNVRVNGRQLFQAKQIASRGGQFDMPRYEFNRTIQGELIGIRRVATRNGDVESVVARVRTNDGRTMDVLLGSPQQLRRQGTVIRRGSRVDVDGYVRESDGRRTFFVQSAQVSQPSRRDRQLQYRDDQYQGRQDRQFQDRRDRQLQYRDDQYQGRQDRQSQDRRDRQLQYRDDQYQGRQDRQSQDRRDRQLQYRDDRQVDQRDWRSWQDNQGWRDWQSESRNWRNWNRENQDQRSSRQQRPLQYRDDRSRSMQDRDSDRQQTMRQDSRRQPSAQAIRLKKANAVLGQKVLNHQGKTLGTIENLIVDVDDSTVRYAVLSVQPQGRQDGQGNLTPIPFQLLHTRTNSSQLLLDIPQDKLSQAPRFTRNSWPDVSSSQWNTRVLEFHLRDQLSRQMGRDADQWDSQRFRDSVEASQFRNQQRLTQIIGTRVQNDQGSQLGEIEDLAIRMSNGDIAFAVLSYSSNNQQKVAAVPFGSLDIDLDADTASLSADKSKLDQVAVSQQRSLQLSSRDFQRRVYNRFDKQAPWQVYSLDQRQPLSDEATIRFKGTVQSTGSFRTQSGQTDGLRLRVQDENGQSHTVYAGPKRLAQQEGFQVKQGSEVTIRGIEASVNGRDVILATEISSGGKTLSPQPRSSRRDSDAARTNRDDPTYYYLYVEDAGSEWTTDADTGFYSDEDYEYEPGEGLHEEEWYDPSDWFNEDNRVDFEED